MKTFREYLAEAKVEKEVINESIKYIKASAEKQWDELKIGELTVKIPDDDEFDITISIGKSEMYISFDDMSELCKRISKLM